MSTFEWTDLEVRRALGLRTDIARERSYTGVSTDTRTLRPGDVYVALVGDRFDGHDFVADAVAAGARAAVVSKPVPAARDLPLYPVTDTLDALGRLAAHRRAALSCPVVAVTGSTGKTTTKDFLAAALGNTLRTHATRGNRNNRIGLPLTLLDVSDRAEAVVLELGTNEPGEIWTLTQIARPDVAVITTVGESHLERLGSIEGVMDEKLDLLRGLGEGARSVVGDDPPELPERARRIRPDVRVAGWSEQADEESGPEAVEVDAFGSHRFVWHGHAVSVPLPGRHAVADALLALTVADLLGVPAEAAASGLSHAKTGALRGQTRRVGGLTLLVDCYNANPQSVRAALAVLREHESATARVAVLGTMLELGEASDRLHEATLAEALRGGIDLVVATGGFSEAARRAPELPADSVLVAADWRDAYPELKRRLHGDEVVLLKASRGIALEEMLPLLEADFGEDRADDPGSAAVERSFD